MVSINDEECFPPIEFILSTIQHEKTENVHEISQSATIKDNNDEIGSGDYAEERRAAVYCPTCLRRVNELCCAKCFVELGSISEKQRAIDSMRKQRTKLYETYCQRWNSGDFGRGGVTNDGDVETEQSSTTATPDRISSILDTKNDLESNAARLSTLIRLKRESIARNTERWNRLRSERQQRSKIVAKLQSMTDYTRKKASNETSRTIGLASLDRRTRDLATRRQRLVADLLNNVFPLDAVSTSSASSSSAVINSTTSGGAAGSLDEFEGAAGVMDILTDATLTTFLHDRWIFMGGAATDVQYRLVNNCLAPDHGDYSRLKEWLFTDTTTAMAAAAMPTVNAAGGGGGDLIASPPMMTTSDSVISHRGALGTLSALAYCAQLVNATARILDVRLPFNLTFSDFFVDKLKESELDTSIVKLNANVAYLCSSQRMDYECVCFERPFWSLCNMNKNSKNLGYQTPFQVDARVARGFTNAEKHICWSERATVMIVEQTGDDWENINEQIPEWTPGLASSPPTLSQFWTSAATSVANLFKMHN